LAALARSISTFGQFDADALAGWLEETYQSYPGFPTLVIAKTEGVPVAAEPRQLASGATLRDRNDFQNTVTTAAIISQVTIGPLSRE